MHDNISKILLIYTGGTIGMIKDYETGALKAFNFDELLQNIPELKHLEHSIETVSFEEPIDSSNMNPEYYLKIAEIVEEMMTKIGNEKLVDLDQVFATDAMVRRETAALIAAV